MLVLFSCFMATRILYNSSIVNEAIKTISSQFIFLRKYFERTKTQINQNPLTKTKISEQKATKAMVFCAHKNF